MIVYRDHARDAERPKWLKVKGTRFWRAVDLERTQMKGTWHGFLDVMVGMEDVDPKKVLHEKPKQKKRGLKPM